MTISHPPTDSPVTIDLRGPDGNAFVLLGYARRWSKELGHSKEVTDKILEEMMSSDYHHLVNTLEEHFGEYVTFIVPENF